MDLQGAMAQVERELAEVADPKRAVQEKRYLKSALEHLGVTVPGVRKVARRLAAAHPELERSELLDLVRALWATGVYEHRALGVELLELQTGQLQPEDLHLLEELVRGARTWALVDNLAASVAGPLVGRNPSLAAELDRWAADEDFWVRRSALLVHLLALRRGGGDFERFGGYADRMLEEREFFIRKAIGWVLRDTAKRRPELVFEWLLPRARRASGLTLREAVRYLPDVNREQILTAARAGR